MSENWGRENFCTSPQFEDVQEQKLYSKMIYFLKNFILKPFLKANI